MCGIAGIISPRGIDPQHLERMSAALTHRGPDGCGFMVFSDKQGLKVRHNQRVTGSRADRYTVGFVHRRLSIIDPSNSSLQPMKDISNTYCMTYNGEIYNYLELRDELHNLGYTFKTTGDTEVLLRAYEAWGMECLPRLNGMWAFSLLDINRRQLIFSRDRFGIKPLFYTLQNKTLYFASEIKALAAVPEISCEPNEKTVAHFLLTGLSDDTRETFFKGIFQFPAANWVSLSLDGDFMDFRPQVYWSFPIDQYKGTEKDAVQQFRDLFVDSVRLRFRSDVPVGTCLSGGLDSSSIVCSSDVLKKRQQISNEEQLTFGYCASEEAWNEKPYMGVVIANTSVQMHYVKFKPDQFIARLPEILWAQDEPFGSASIAAQWFVFQRANEECIKVMLDGQGADETMAGYHGYFSTVATVLLAAGNLAGYFALRSEYEREIGSFPVSLRSAARQFISKRFPEFTKLAKRFKGVRQVMSNNPLHMALTPSLIRSGFFEQQQTESGAKTFSLNHELKQDIQVRVLPALLRNEDRNSMTHSIESRVPFLDYRLVDFLFTLPDHWKIRGITTKYILREAMKGILPEVIRTRKDKIGFKSAPSLTFDLARINHESLIDNKTDFEKQWFLPEGVERVLKAPDHSVQAEFILWRLINTKLWLRQFWGSGSRVL